MEASVVCFGDNCVDQYDAPQKRQFVGGNAVNTAVHAKEAGCKTAYVGSVGNDANGRAILDKLRQKGIDVSQVQQFEAETAWTRVSLADGERTFLEEYLGPYSSFQLTQTVLDYLFCHTLVHNTWQGGTEHWLSQFRAQGGPLISMDFGERYSQEFLELCIPHVDLAFFSMDPERSGEAKKFGRDMAKLGPEYVIVTMGKNGSMVVTCTGETFFEPALSIPIVDTLGAGDTYIGTFLAAFVQQKSIPDCMREATKAAAHTCSFFSGFEGSEILAGESNV